MIHIPGMKDGGIQNQYGGEIDVLPTLLHLLGISNKNYIQFGTDLLSKQHSQIVAFRNNDFVTPTYSSIGNTLYDQNGNEITDPSDAFLKKVKKDRKAAHKQLEMSIPWTKRTFYAFTRIPT